MSQPEQAKELTSTQEMFNMSQPAQPKELTSPQE